MESPKNLHAVTELPLVCPKGSGKYVVMKAMRLSTLKAVLKLSKLLKNTSSCIEEYVVEILTKQETTISIVNSQ